MFRQVTAAGMEAKVHLYMATLPDRIGTLRKAMLSLGNQVDTIQVVVNNFSRMDLFREFNPWLPLVEYNTFMGKPLTVIEHDNSLKDGSRFIGADQKEGYCLVCDDDIEYPPDFVSRMIEVYNSQPMAFLTVMGKNLNTRPLKSYYKGWKENYRTFDEIKELTRVDIPGCCGIIWHSDVITVNESVMKVPNSDVCIGVLAREKRVQCYVIPHPANWLKNLMPELPNGTMDIFKRYRNNDKEQTDFINKYL